MMEAWPQRTLDVAFDNARQHDDEFAYMDQETSSGSLSSDAEKLAESIHGSKGNHDDSREPTIPVGPIVPRYIAAALDNVVAMILGVVAAKSVSDDLPVVQVGLLIGVYLGYYFLFEAVIARTPGKLLAGLVVVQFDGARCNWHQSAVRTGFRVLEVNPILLGGIPAALIIACSRRRQRLGDKCARTIVVESRLIKR